MSTRTSTLLIASALTAAAFTLSVRAEPPDATAPDNQVIPPPRATAPQDRATADATKEKAPAAKRARTPDNQWWQEERALDDGYVWPLPSASRRGASAAVAGGEGEVR